MRRGLALLVLLAALLPATAYAKLTLPDVESDYMCVTCGTPLNVSEAPSADRERAFIQRRIDQGRTEDQIKREMVAVYGPKVLATPRDKSWVVPIALAILAVVSVGFTVTRWRRSATPEPAAPALDDADARRLADDMKAYDL